MVKLIVNADDFGLCESNTLGIIEAYKNGIVRSTTMMANQPYAKEAAKLMKEYPGLGVGLHLNLTVGTPLCKDLKTIVDENGHFINQFSYQNRKVDINEIKKEYQAQMDEFIELTGQLPTHIDHHHSYTLIPEQLGLIKALADQYDLPMRGGMVFENDYAYENVEFIQSFYDNTATLDWFLENKGQLDQYEIVEMMSHPGYAFLDLFNWTSYTWQRVRELTVLTNPKVKDYLSEHNIELINYTQIKKK